MAAKRILTKKERGEAPRRALDISTIDPFFNDSLRDMATAPKRGSVSYAAAVRRAKELGIPENEAAALQFEGEVNEQFDRDKSGIPQDMSGERDRLFFEAAVEKRLKEKEQQAKDYATNRQVALAIEAAAGDAADRKAASDDYASKRQVALAIEAAAGDADYRKKRDAAIAAEPEYYGDEQAMPSDTSERAIAPESKPVKMVNPLDKMQESLKQPNTIFPQYGSLSDMARSQMPSTMEAPTEPLKATPVYDPALTQQLFKVTTGTSFNPKAKGDIGTMEKIETMLGEMDGKLGKMTPNQFALQFYRRFQ